MEIVNIQRTVVILNVNTDTVLIGNQEPKPPTKTMQTKLKNKLIGSLSDLDDRQCEICYKDFRGYYCRIATEEGTVYICRTCYGLTKRIRRLLQLNILEKDLELTKTSTKTNEKTKIVFL